jgi:hypothetical protein
MSDASTTGTPRTAWWQWVVRRVWPGFPAMWTLAAPVAVPYLCMLAWLGRDTGWGWLLEWTRWAWMAGSCLVALMVTVALTHLSSLSRVVPALPPSIRWRLAGFAALTALTALALAVRRVNAAGLLWLAGRAVLALLAVLQSREWRLGARALFHVAAGIAFALSEGWVCVGFLALGGAAVILMRPGLLEVAASKPSRKAFARRAEAACAIGGG